MPKKEFTIPVDVPMKQKAEKTESVTIEFLDFYDDEPYEKPVEKDEASGNDEESDYEPAADNVDTEEDSSDVEPSTSFKGSKIKPGTIKLEPEDVHKISECFVKIEALDPSNINSKPTNKRKKPTKVEESDDEESDDDDDDDEPLVKKVDKKIVQEGTEKKKNVKLLLPRKQHDGKRQTRAEKYVSKAIWTLKLIII